MANWEQREGGMSALQTRREGGRRSSVAVEGHLGGRTSSVAVKGSRLRGESSPVAVEEARVIIEGRGRVEVVDGRENRSSNMC